MKRQIPPPVSEAPPSRRKRGLSEEERALWETVAGQIKPLRKKPPPAKPAIISPGEETPAEKKSAGVSPRRLDPATSSRPAKPEVPPLAPLGRRERAQLSRGRKQIDARLDLHGMTQTHAHHALSSFLRRAHHDGLSFVLVITGKGQTGAGADRGVLRRQVPQWLGLPEFRALVVGFEEAHIGHGGAGALYVRIRRPKI
jgi:DNA-nicking Smr family endonuclease